MSISKQSAPGYFAWGLNMCLFAGGAGLFVDLIPEDGNLREFSLEEETLLGQSLERMAVSRFKGFGTVSRVHCGEHTSPEILYVAVAHAVREVATQLQKQREKEQGLSGGVDLSKPDQSVVAATTTAAVTGVAESVSSERKNIASVNQTNSIGQQQQNIHQQTSRNENKENIIAPHVFIVQDIDRTPARTLECLTEMLVIKSISAPLGMAVGVLPDHLQLPSQFVIVASSSRVPRPSMTTTLTTSSRESQVSDRLMSGFLLRIPITLPRAAPLHSVAPSRLSNMDIKALLEKAPKVYLNDSIIKYVRDTVSAVRSHPLVACGLPPKATDALYLAIRTQAALRGSLYAIPEDLTNCAIEVLAHRIIVASAEVLPPDFKQEHPVYLARLIIAASISSLSTIR